jgi:hypothetical protein
MKQTGCAGIAYQACSGSQLILSCERLYSAAVPTLAAQLTVNTRRPTVTSLTDEHVLGVPLGTAVLRIKGLMYMQVKVAEIKQTMLQVYYCSCTP